MTSASELMFLPRFVYMFVTLTVMWLPPSRGYVSA